MVEHLFYTQGVAGSNPVGTILLALIAQRIEHRSSKAIVPGWNPGGGIGDLLSHSPVF